MQLLSVVDVSKQYGKDDYVTNALKNVSFEIHEGEFLAIMGASGSGKSTLLNCISTIDTPTSGKIYYRDFELTAATQKQLAKYRGESVSYVFQNYNLITTLTAYENMVLPIQLRGASISENLQLINSIIEHLDIGGITKKFPDELSGGQRQRVAIARALINNTKLLIADEPTGALDSANSENLMNLFSRINRELNVTILMVTHDVEAAKYSTRVLFLKDGCIQENLIRQDESSLIEYKNRIIEVTR